MTEKSWFVMRYNHFPPETIKLGQLINNPKEPHQVIDLTGPQPFPADMQYVKAVEEQFSWEKSSSKEGHAGLSAEVEALPIAASISGEFKRTNRDWADFDSLETEYIIPTAEYEKVSMTRPTVKTSLRNSIILRSVFMITGIKIARRASRGRETSNSAGGALALGITPTPAVPVSLGPDIGYNTSESHKTNSKATDFVWAFSLRQIFYRFGEVTTSSTYDEGATLAEGSRRRAAEQTADDNKVVLDVRDVEIEIDGSKEFNGENSRLVPIEDVRFVGEDYKLVLVDGV